MKGQYGDALRGGCSHGSLNLSARTPEQRGRKLLRGVFCHEAAINRQHRLLLVVVQPRVGDDGINNGVGLRFPRIKHSCSLIERLSRDFETARNLLKNLGGRLAQTSLNLREVWVGYSSTLGEIANRLLCDLSLLTNERADVGTFTTRHCSATFVEERIDT